MYADPVDIDLARNMRAAGANTASTITHRQTAPVAQWIEPLNSSQRVAGSSPARRAIFPPPRPEQSRRVFCF